MLLTYNYQFDTLVLDPITPGQIKNHNKYDDVSILWDTGADKSCITPKLQKDLGAEVIDKHVVRTASGKYVLADLCKVDLKLINNDGSYINISDLEVYVLDIGADVIIGMNTISCGKFVLEKVEDHTRLSFEVES